MRTFNEYITEIFDNPYPFKLGKKSATDTEYSFVLASGKTMKVLVHAGPITGGDKSIRNLSKGSLVGKVKIHELSFGIEGEASNKIFGKTNQGDAFRIFATVFKIMTEFISKNKPKIFVFSTNTWEKTRLKLYKTFSKKIKMPGYTKESFQTQLDFVVALYDKSVTTEDKRTLKGGFG